MEGHRTAPRAVCWNKNESIAASVSSIEIKLWNVEEHNCIRSLSCDDGLNCLFGPNDHFMFGATKTGKLKVFTKINVFSFLIYCAAEL